MTDEPSTFKRDHMLGLSTGAYTYKPLGTNEIRLLRILPPNASDEQDFGDAVAPLCAELFSATLDALPDYEALSYAWGRPIFDQPLLLSSSKRDVDQEGQLLITTDLSVALTHLRSAKAPRILWIDQVCINQKDLEERSSQVCYMAQIYRCASKTVIWLGMPECDQDISSLEDLFRVLDERKLSEDERAQRLIDNPAKYWRLVDLPEDTRRMSVQLWHDKAAIAACIDVRTSDLSTVGARRRRAVVNLFNQNWFSRTWVVQEVLLAKDVEILYGPLRQTLEALYRLGTSVVFIENSALGWKHHLMNTTSGYAGFSYIADAKFRMPADNKIGEEFFEFMSKIRQNFFSADPRDKLYGILGVKPLDSPPDVSPDYTKATAEVYTEAAQSFINHTSSLEILSAAEDENRFTCPCPNSVRLGSALPSWVPNWYHQFHGPSPFSSGFRACRGRKHTPLNSQPKPGSNLSLNGKVVSVVDRVMPERFDDYTPFIHGLQKMLQLDAIVAQVDPMEYKSDREHAILRTLLADGSSGDSQPLKYSLDRLLEVYRSEQRVREVKAEQSDDYRTLQYIQNCSLVLQRRRFFLAHGLDSSWFGLGSWLVKPGDLVCIFYGSSVPCLIREHAVSSKTGQQQYKFVGQCYLDGWMYGHNEFESWWSEFENGAQCFVIV